VRKFLKNDGGIIALIKPLFETEFYENNRFEIIQDPKVLIKIITDLIDWCVIENFFPYGITKSPLLGKGGSLEFFIYLKIEKKSHYYDYKNKVNNLL